jgi:hypothetical protein
MFSVEFPAHGATMFILNVCTHLANYRLSYLRRPKYEY